MVDEEEEEEDIPEGLDDLLGSIQDEPAEETPEPKVTTVKASAIVPSKFFGEDKYAKYRDELVADGTIEGEQLTSEERKEGFKTRNDSDKFSRFVENFLDRKKESDNEETKTLGGRGGALVVPKQPKINVDPVEEESKSNFDDILKGIDSILEVIKKDQKFEEKQANKERKKEEREGRSVREGKLEKKDNVLLKTAKKVLAPVKSIFDKIIEFFTTIFLGRALMKLLDWFGDKENGKKIDSIIRFLGDWWPALLGGFLLFGTGLGGLISSITGLLVTFTPKILALLANPIVAGAGLFAAGALIPKMFPQTVEDSADKQANESVKEQGKDKTIADLKAQNENRNPLQKFGDFITGAGAEREEQIQKLETGKEKSYGFSGETKDPPKQMKGGGLVSNNSSILAMNNGGVVEKQDNNSFNMFNPMSWFSGDAQKATTGELGEVSNDTLAGKLYNRRKQQEEMMQKMRGYKEGGKVTGKTGIDKVPAMLTDGEFVMSAGAVQKYGLDTMMAMNAAGGGTNKPKIMQGTMYANEGGPVVGRENLSPKAQKALTRLDAQKAGEITPDMQYTRNGTKISAEQFNKVGSGNIIPGGGKPGGFLGGMMDGAKNMLGGMFSGMGKPPAPAPGQKVVDGNIGKPTTQEQKDINALDAKKEKLKQSQQKLIEMKGPAKPSQDDASLKAEYNMIQDNPHHPLFEKVRGGDIDDFGMRFSEFKEFKKQQAQTNPQAQVAKATPEKREAAAAAGMTVAAAAASEKNKPMTLVDTLTNAINSMAGVGSMLGGGKDGNKESTREYSQANLEGAKLGDGHGSEGQKIAGDLGTFMKQKKSALPVTGSIHRHPKHLPWGKSGHSANSYHYDGRALDIGGWAPSHPSSSGNDEQAPVLKSID